MPVHDQRVEADLLNSGEKLVEVDRFLKERAAPVTGTKTEYITA
jgi:hypothetical protein